jgi:cephalosporin hydroxylase
MVHDLEKFPYPIKDESCLTIKAAHVMEHIKPWLVIDWMNEMWRMLKIDGQLAISAPYANSPLYLQDPTHCTPVTERTWLYFDCQSPIYSHYQPKPWRVSHIAYKPDGNIEAILQKQQLIGSPTGLTEKAMMYGAVQKPSELSDFLTFIQGKKMDVVLEIGSAKGGVFYALCQLADEKATMISLDLPGGPFGTFTITEDTSFQTFIKPRQTLHRIKKDSHKAATKTELLKILKGKKIDVLFIDGDHTYPGVKKDWEMYSPLVRKGGIIVFHDINFHPRDIAVQVSKLWKEIKPNFKVVEFIDPVDPTWAGIGALEYENHTKKK